MGWWTNLWKTRSKDWMFEPLLAAQVPDRLSHARLDPDQGYVSVFLRSMRITNVRKGLSKFFGTVHSSITVLHMGEEGKAEFQSVVTPNELKDQDVKHLDRVVARNLRLLGPVPYRGGDLEMEIGLFSIKSADLAAPYLTLLESLASTAGVAYLSAAMPFVGPIKEGIALLTGGSDETVLEIGLSTIFAPAETGHFFVMRAEAGTVDPSSLHLDDAYRLVDESNRPIQDYPYMVLACEVSSRRDDWVTIPEVKRAYDDLQRAVRSGKLEDAEEAFGVFRRTALTSPDLLFNHAQALVAEVEERMMTVLGATTVARKDERGLPGLESYDPF